METETEPYVRLASLRELHQVVAQLNTARSMADTLQTIADGTVTALGFELASVNVVRPDGDLLVAAVAGADRGEVDKAEAAIAGRTGSRASWERRLSMGERWGELRFIPYTEGWVLDHDGVPQWHTTGPAPRYPDEWHPMDRLFAPMYASDGELLAVLEVDKPRNGRRPGPWGCEALQLYASQAAIAISNARLRGNMQRALVRLEREQEALRASEESFRQAFEYAPSGMAIAEVGGDGDGRLLRVNDALCRLLDRTVAVLRRYSFADLVHPEDMGTLLRTANDGGRAELRLARKDGSYIWVNLRNSVVADPAAGPQVQLTHVEDIEERKRHELALAHRASHDSLTGLPNSAELRARLGGRICAHPPEGRPHPAPSPEALSVALFDGPGGARPHHGFDHHHEHVWQPDAPGGDGKGLAVLFCDLDGFKSINDRFGHVCGDAVLVEVARRLEQGVRDNDTVARLGGDEFVVLAEGLGPRDAADLAVRLRNGIVPAIRVEGRSVRVGASFGIGWAACGMTTEEILQSADQRMYMEKRSRAQGRRRAG
ncbi:diguanylate cyclase CdgB [Streptomyces sp. DSM 44915]|uniref:Diguanylate cyclase CdgB n=1 Tax=Streptomyces chisholmiae TaxID=3075540 RepID=A0ABU2JSY6_9ACTN|nr:diguanylate cyclase CdgB [Streptomyces sp. DSM 44915]MDT0268097.1 diguanylate cyclase CdgB [Streptomyces sp. DSM 44915]